MRTARNSGHMTYDSNPMWDGGTINVHGSRGVSKRNCKPIWPKIALFVLKHKLDPERFVKAQFLKLGMKRAPTPNFLVGQKALDKYYAWPEFEEISEQEIKSALMSGTSIYNLQVEEIRAITGWPADKVNLSVLMDTTLGMSAIFRYCMACKVKQPKAARYYFRAAAWQYCREDKLYDEFWGDFVPAKFKSQAKEIFDVFGDTDG